MRTATLVRDHSDDTSLGTFGKYTSDSGFQCYILERPGSGDHPCIPVGTYSVEIKPHPEHGNCYELQNVTGRSAILIHSANVYEQLLGCLAPGRSVQQIGIFWHGDPINHVGVTSSRDALIALMADMSGESFQLTITQA